MNMNVPRCRINWIFFDSDCWCIIVVLVLHADIILFYVDTVIRDEAFRSIVFVRYNKHMLAYIEQREFGIWYNFN